MLIVGIRRLNLTYLVINNQSNSHRGKVSYAQPLDHENLCGSVRHTLELGPEEVSFTAKKILLPRSLNIDGFIESLKGYQYICLVNINYYHMR